MKKISRNAPCHCGSELKYKYCYGNESVSGTFSKTPAFFLIIGVIVITLIVTIFNGSSDNPQLQRDTYTPQPPGAVPPGKVWSPEHGHWHDVSPN